MPNPSALLSSKKTRRLSVQLMTATNEHRNALIQVAGTLNRHIALISKATFFERLRWLLTGYLPPIKADQGGQGIEQ